MATISSAKGGKGGLPLGGWGDGRWQMSEKAARYPAWSSADRRREQAKGNRTTAKKQKRCLQATKMIIGASSDDAHNCFALYSRGQMQGRGEQRGSQGSEFPVSIP